MWFGSSSKPKGRSSILLCDGEGDAAVRQLHIYIETGTVSLLPLQDIREILAVP